MMVLTVLFAAPDLYSQAWVQQQTSVPSEFSAVSFLDDFTGYISGAYGVVYKTTDGGLNWVHKPTGMWRHFSDQYFVSSSTGWIVGQSGTILKTTNGGNSWTEQPSGTTSWLNVVQFIDGSTGWAAGEGGIIIKTTNGGTTWVLQTCGTSSTIEGAWFMNVTSGYQVCKNGMVLKTQNGGSNWSTAQIALTALHGITFANQSIGWTVGASGKIMKTLDGGASWTDQSSGTTVGLNSVSFADANIGWVVGDGGKILSTTNGGASWTNQDSWTTKNLRSVYFVNANHGYAVGLNNTVLEYSSLHPVPVQLAGFTATVVNNNAVRLDWRTITEVNNYGFEVERSTGTIENFELLQGSFIAGGGTTNQPREYTLTDFDAPSGRLYYRLKQIDLDGTINRTEPLAVDVLTGVDENATPSAFLLKQNYPNPFNPSTTIAFDLPFSGFVSLKVFDVLGREVATIVNEELNQGSYLKTFLAEGLSSGVYWYALKAGEYSQTRKLLLSK